MTDGNMNMNSNAASPYSSDMPPMPTPSPKGKKQTVDAQMFEKVAKDVNSVGASLRILEERHSLMRNKSQVTEESMIDLEKNISKDLKTLNDEVLDLKHEIKNVLDKIRLIDAEMKNLTKKDEFKVIERYLDMWQPMNFVTRNELDKLIQEKEEKQIKK